MKKIINFIKEDSATKIVLSIILILVFLILDRAFSTKHEQSGQYLSNHYSPSKTNVGNNSKGDVIVTTESEEYIIFAKEGDQTVKIKSDINSFNKYETGDQIKYYIRKGRFTGIIHGRVLK